jgi:putative salt-induced outer membrane protein
MLTIGCGMAGVASAQPAGEPESVPLWDVQLGASYVGTTGNSETSAFGANFEAHRRWPLWIIDGTASAVRDSQSGIETAEQYIAAIRARRKLTDRIAATSGLKLERDPIGGLDLRSTLDGGLSYAIVREPHWTFDGLSSLAWIHEERVTGETRNDLGAVLGVLSKYLLGTAGETSQRFTYFPNFSNSTAYRTEAEATAQAAMNKRLALKFGFLWRYQHDPAPGFKRGDTTTTASIVVRWRADAPAPASAPAP